MTILYDPGNRWRIFVQEVQRGRGRTVLFGVYLLAASVALLWLIARSGL